MDFLFVGLIVVFGAASVLTVAACARLKEKK